MLQFREAVEKDISLILKFIKELADYEKLLDDVTNNEKLIKEWLFDKKIARTVFLVLDDKEIGFFIYFYNYSTFTGKAGIYLEDLFIKEEYRGKGYGRKVFEYLENKALEEGCGRMEWVCLNWNKDSIEFYKKRGAIPMDEWTTYRKSF